MNRCLTQFCNVTGPVTEKPTTTIPEPTFNTPEPGVDYDVTVYVDVVTAVVSNSM